jgi:hypothetical protein
MQTPLICPHENTLEWLKRFFYEAGLIDLSLNDTIWASASNINCLGCRCYDEAGRKRWSYEHIEIKVWRDVGDVE